MHFFRSIVVFLGLVVICTNCYAQQLPPIVKYSKEVYNAGIQNWMISQDKQRFQGEIKAIEERELFLQDRLKLFSI